MGERGRPRHPETLTPRQYEVWLLLREGLTNEEIAARLGISPDGVKFHMGDILRRLGVATRHEAAARDPEDVRRPWWAGALAPLGWSRRLRPLALPYATGAAITIAALSAIALLLWGVVRSSRQEPASADGPTTVELAAPIGEIVFSVDGALWTVNADGSGLARVLARGDAGAAISSPSFSPEGARLAYIEDRRRVVVLDLDTREREAIDLYVDRTPPPPAASDMSIGPSAVHWSPNGDWLLVTRTRIGGGGNTDVLVLRPDGSERHTIIPEGRFPRVLEATWWESRAPDSGVGPSIVLLGGADGLEPLAYDLDGNVIGTAHAPTTIIGAAVHQMPRDDGAAIAPPLAGPQAPGPITIARDAGEWLVAERACGMAWSPEGRRIAYYDGTDVNRVFVELGASSAWAIASNPALGVDEERDDGCAGFGVTWREVSRAGEVREYENPWYGIALRFSAEWIGDPSYGGGIGDIWTAYSHPDGMEQGFVRIDAWGSADLAVAVEATAHHKLKPFGEEPVISDVVLPAGEAVLIMPDPSTSPEPRHASVLLPFPTPYEGPGGSYAILTIEALPEDIMAIAESLRFIDRIE